MRALVLWQLSLLRSRAIISGELRKRFSGDSETHVHSFTFKDQTRMDFG